MNSVLNITAAQVSDRHWVKWVQQIQRNRLGMLALQTDIEIRSAHDGAVSALDIESEERYLLSGGADGRVSLYDLKSNTKPTSAADKIRCNCIVSAMSVSNSQQYSSHLNYVSSVQWYPIDNGLFCTSGLDGVLKLWDTNNFSVAANFNIGDKVYASKMNTSGKIAVASGSESVKICDPMTGSFTHTLVGHSSAIMSVDWDPYSEYILASGSADGSVMLWDTRKGGISALLLAFDWRELGQSHKNSANVGKPFTRVVKNSTDSKIQSARRDFSRAHMAKAHDGGVMSLKFSRCGRFLLSSGNDGRLRMWDPQHGTLFDAHFQTSCKSKLAYQMCIAELSGGSSEDTLIYPAGKSGDIYLARLHSISGQRVHALKGHYDMVNAICFLPARLLCYCVCVCVCVCLFCVYTCVFMRAHTHPPPFIYKRLSLSVFLCVSIYMCM